MGNIKYTDEEFWEYCVKYPCNICKNLFKDELIETVYCTIDDTMVIGIRCKDFELYERKINEI